MAKENISIRIDTGVLNYIDAKAREGITRTQIMNQLLKLGLQSRKELSEILEDKRKIALEFLNLEDTDEKIRLMMKRAFMVNNFKKLIWKIRLEKDINKTNYEALKTALLERLKNTFGEESEEYRGVIEWLTNLEK